MKELVLTVSRDTLFIPGYFNGFKKEKKEDYLNIIYKDYRFKARQEVENDSQFKQIIPYQIFRQQNRFFLMKRLKTQKEVRLHHKYSLGIGGHINLDDKKGSDNFILSGMKREFEEEIKFSANYHYQLLGLINDDQDPIGAVHFGLVYLICANSGEVRVKEEDKMRGELLTLEEIKTYENKMEGWSKIVLSELLLGSK